MTILLNNEKLIFIKGSKVAGSSFELALSKFSQKNDIVTPLNQNEELIRKELNYPSPKNYHYKLNEMLFVNRKAFIKKILSNNIEIGIIIIIGIQISIILKCYLNMLSMN